jgi:hypothetical protein
MVLLCLEGIVVMHDLSLSVLNPMLLSISFVGGWVGAVLLCRAQRMTVKLIVIGFPLFLVVIAVPQ